MAVHKRDGKKGVTYYYDFTVNGRRYVTPLAQTKKRPRERKPGAGLKWKRFCRGRYRFSLSLITIRRIPCLWNTQKRDTSVGRSFTRSPGEMMSTTLRLSRGFSVI